MALVPVDNAWQRMMEGLAIPDHAAAAIKEFESGIISAAYRFRGLFRQRPVEEEVIAPAAAYFHETVAKYGNFWGDLTDREAQEAGKMFAFSLFSRDAKEFARSIEEQRRALSSVDYIVGHTVSRAREKVESLTRFHNLPIEFDPHSPAAIEFLREFKKEKHYFNAANAYVQACGFDPKTGKALTQEAEALLAKAASPASPHVATEHPSTVEPEAAPITEPSLKVEPASPPATGGEVSTVVREAEQNAGKWSTGGKVALIGGAALLLGGIVYGSYRLLEKQKRQNAAQQLTPAK